ncbi:protein Atg16l2 [Rana temporaria]|uniref:protein Atg16l2 n=1 Tax=Rana temporaria TaxID=8407 RepID=UPI001AAD70A4|nr:protein Atg16l2 [Rana temporaria]
MQRPEGDSGIRWKRNIVRQLRDRDRSQHTAFRDLVLSYNKLLEKSVFLKGLTEKIQTEPLASPGTHHATRSPSDVFCSPGSGDLSALQKEIAEIKTSNGELAFEACERKKRVQERDDWLKKQNTRIAELLDEEETRRAQRQCLEEEEVWLVCENADLKEKYDHLLTHRLWMEQELQDKEMEQREMIEKMTTKKAIQAEQQNNMNERRWKEMWTRTVKKALTKTLSAEGDIRQHRSSDPLDSRSLDWSGSLEGGKMQPKKNRSQSMIALGSSRLLGAVKNLFDLNFRRDQTDCEMEERWYHPRSVCVACSPPRRALYSKEIHDSEIHAVRFSPNSKMVATGGADRMVKLWYIVGGQLQMHQTLQGSNGGITSIEFDPSGLQLLAASFNGSAHLWKLDGSSKETLTGHTGKVTAAKFKMSVQRAVTCSMDRTIREWDLQKAACIRQIPVSSYCSDVVCSDMYTISGHHDKKIRFWDSRSENCVRELTLEEKITSLSMGQDQTQLLSCSRDDALSLIDLRRGEILHAFRAEGFKCGCDWTKAVLSPDSSYAMAGSSDGTIFIWNTQTGLLERSLNGEHSAAVNAVAWSLSGDYVVSVDRGRKAVLWSEY